MIVGKRIICERYYDDGLGTTAIYYTNEIRVENVFMHCCALVLGKLTSSIIYAYASTMYA